MTNSVRSLGSYFGKAAPADWLTGSDRDFQKVSTSAAQFPNGACAACGIALLYKPPALRGPYCSRKCAGRGKRTLPIRRACEVCQSIWTPLNRFQAARNKTCSPECNAVRLSRVRKGKIRAARTPCARCGKQTYKAPTHLRRNAKAYCSHSCRAKAVSGAALTPHSHKGRAAWTESSHVSYRQKMTGPHNPAWKGGATYRKRRGNYVSVKYVRCPPNLISMARADGYVMEHRLVMAQWIGRPLIRVECVHHADHQPLNNARTNLELWPCNRSHKSAEHGIIVEGAANRLFPRASAQL